MRSPHFLVALLLSASLAAQTGLVVPQSVGNAEGNDSHWTPLRYCPNRTQWHVDASEIGASSATWSQMSMRRDGATSTSYVAKTIEIEIWMNEVSAPPALGHWRFSRNLAGATRVFDRKNFVLSAPPQPGNGPAPFSETFKFDRRFSYFGKTLVVDVQTFHAQETQYWVVDAESYKVQASQAPDEGAAAVGSVMCPSNFSSSRAGSNWPGGAIALYGYSRVAPNTTHAGILAIGGSRTQWVRLQLPFALDAFGGPGCEIGGSIDIVMPCATDPQRSDGYIYVEVDVPNKPWVRGLEFTWQYYVLDLGFNGLGFRISRRYTNVIGKHGYLTRLPGITLYNYFSKPGYDVAIYRRELLPIIELQ